MGYLSTCLSCGKPLVEGSNFCSSCGAKCEAAVPVSETSNICKRCSAEFEQNQLFCPSCGKKRQDASSPKSEKRSVVGWITHSVSLFVAIFLIITAFLPTISYRDIEINDEIGKIDLSLSAIDNIVFCFDAIHMLDNEDLYDSILYEKFEELSENTDDFGKKEARQFLKLACRLNLQSEETLFLPQYAISAMISLIYIMFALAFFTVTVIDFILFAIGKGKDRLSRTVLIMLAAIPALALSASLTFSTSFNLNQAYQSNVSGAVISLTVISLITLTFLAIKHFFLGKKRPTVSAKAIVKRSLSIVASLLMMLSVLLPLANYEVKTTFKGSSKPARVSRELNVSFFENFALSGSELEMYENPTMSKIKNAAEYYQHFTKKEFKNGSTSYTDTQILIGGFCLYGGIEVVGLISLVPIFLILASIVGAILLWQNLAALISDVSPHIALTIPLKVIGAISAIFALALVTVFVCVTGFNLSDIKFESAKPALRISAGAIFVPMFAIFAAAVPMGKKKKLNNQSVFNEA